MTDIKWGPAIAVDGKRPGFVSNGDAVLLPWEDMPVSKSGRAYGAWASGTLWKDIPSLRLPADHPHYRQTEAAIPEGMKAWHGGDAAPADWDSEKPVAVIDDGKVSIRSGHRWDWSREPVTAYGHKLLRVVAYTPQPTPQADTKPDLAALLDEAQQRLDDLTRSHDALRARLGMPPRNVDPALLEARKLAAVWSKRDDVSHADYLNGRLDSSAEVQLALAAFEGGRALALAGEEEA